jgi:hypothetical protein
MCRSLNIIIQNVSFSAVQKNIQPDILWTLGICGYSKKTTIEEKPRMLRMHRAYNCTADAQFISPYCHQLLLETS